ncbi:hypothetical protein Psi02_60880 [Planotetraspora silvatica]|uniref:Uncharacterized protein n=1 Tax=Planotetraspora silvatica TaxID=234614 RepID=A0A8J3UWF8_9ACTN|nr:hypothetical protein [Planotetraspora silvatica]GII49664.1 hypothetical protein Psi02_60880 [Planotetraspora silvatica]
MHQLKGVPVLRTEVRIAAVVVRVILLAVLLWGSLVAVLSALPRERSAEDFHARWDAGQITYLAYRTDWSTSEPMLDLRWSTGPLAWHHTQVPETWRELQGRLSSPIKVIAERRKSGEDDGRWLMAVWPFKMSDIGAGPLVPIAWFVTLLVMLGTDRHRLGNRWAWLWLFTLGQFGACFYLVFEPRPLWWGLEDRRPATGRIGGLQGLVFAFGAQLVIGLLFSIS